jgi:hypothetical protein
MKDPVALRGLILSNHSGVNATADVEVTLDARTPRTNRGHEVVQDAVDDGLVESALVAVRPQVQLPRLEFDAQPVGDVLDPNRSEIGLTRLGTKTSELVRLETDEVVSVRLRVGESIERLGWRAAHAPAMIAGPSSLTLLENRNDGVLPLGGPTG